MPNELENAVVGAMALYSEGYHDEHDVVGVLAIICDEFNINYPVKDLHARLYPGQDWSHLSHEEITRT